MSPIDAFRRIRAAAVREARTFSAFVRGGGADRAQLFGGNSTPLGDILGQSEESAERKSFRRDFNTGNFDSFGGDATAGKFVEIARFKIPADVEYRFGFGAAKNPDNQGYQYIDLRDGGDAEVEGTIRYVIESATGRRQEVIADYDTETLDASKTDRTEQVPLPEQVSVTATQDAFLVLKFDPTANSTVDESNSEVIVPVTEYDLS
jgi:hypothetical protein